MNEEGDDEELLRLRIKALQTTSRVHVEVAHHSETSGSDTEDSCIDEEKVSSSQPGSENEDVLRETALKSLSKSDNCSIITKQKIVVKDKANENEELLLRERALKTLLHKRVTKTQQLIQNKKNAVVLKSNQPAHKNEKTLNVTAKSSYQSNYQEIGKSYKESQIKITATERKPVLTDVITEKKLSEDKDKKKKNSQSERIDDFDDGFSTIQTKNKIPSITYKDDDEISLCASDEEEEEEEELDKNIHPSSLNNVFTDESKVDFELQKVNKPPENEKFFVNDQPKDDSNLNGLSEKPEQNISISTKELNKLEKDIQFENALNSVSLHAVDSICETSENEVIVENQVPELTHEKDKKSKNLKTNNKLVTSHNNMNEMSKNQNSNVAETNEMLDISINPSFNEIDKKFNDKVTPIDLNKSNIETIQNFSIPMHSTLNDTANNTIQTINNSEISISQIEVPETLISTSTQIKNNGSVVSTSSAFDADNHVNESQLIPEIETESEIVPELESTQKPYHLNCQPGPSGYKKNEPKNYNSDSSDSITEISPPKKVEPLLIELSSGEEEYYLDVNEKRKRDKAIRRSLVKQEGERDDLKDVTCSVCLGPFVNRSFLNECFHSFCYLCITQWSELSRLCPLCKTKYTSLIHTVTKDLQYEQYYFEELPDKANKASRSTEFSQDMEDGRRFRYRSTITSNETWALRRAEREQAERERMSEQRQRKMERRLKWSATKDRRKAVYRMNMTVKDVKQRGVPKYRNITPQFFDDNPALKHRLVPWLLRDLNVLLGNDDDGIRFVMSMILNIVSKISMEEEEFEKQLKPFLFNETKHFITELISFARSPYDIRGYDDNVVYDVPLKKTESVVTVVTSPLITSSIDASFRDHLHNKVLDLTTSEVTDIHPEIQPEEEHPPPSSPVSYSPIPVDEELKEDGIEKNLNDVTLKESDIEEESDAEESDVNNTDKKKKKKSKKKKKKSKKHKKKKENDVEADTVEQSANHDESDQERENEKEIQEEGDNEETATKTRSRSSHKSKKKRKKTRQRSKRSLENASDDEESKSRSRRSRSPKKKKKKRNHSGSNRREEVYSKTRLEKNKEKSPKQKRSEKDKHRNKSPSSSSSDNEEEIARRLSALKERYRKRNEHELSRAKYFENLSKKGKISSAGVKEIRPEIRKRKSESPTETVNIKRQRQSESPSNSHKKKKKEKKKHKKKHKKRKNTIMRVHRVIRLLEKKMVLVVMRNSILN